MSARLPSDAFGRAKRCRHGFMPGELAHHNQRGDAGTTGSQATCVRAACIALRGKGHLMVLPLLFVLAAAYLGFVWWLWL
jgi:hypothetical protein